eukprot:10262746-Alexandrium_andersonii.AAC.1
MVVGAVGPTGTDTAGPAAAGAEDRSCADDGDALHTAADVSARSLPAEAGAAKQADDARGSRCVREAVQPVESPPPALD